MTKKLILFRKIMVLFVIMPSLLSLIQLVGFWIIYLSLTHPILIEYQNLIEFQIALLSAAIGILIVEITIILKSINYVFQEKKGKTKND